MANCIRCGRQLPPFSWKKICQWCVRHEAAQRGEEGDDVRQPVTPVPWVRQGESTITLTHVIFGACIAVFIAMLLATGDPAAYLLDPSRQFPSRVSIPFGANAGPFTLSGDWWRLLSYMFLHGSTLHILFNMWCLWDLGKLCESLYGRWTYAAIYLITGVGGGLASLIWNPRVLSVGASGAIFGLAGALLASLYLGEFSLPRFAIGATLRSLAFFIGFNLLFGAGFNIFGGGAGGIDNACHVGGLVSGLALGALIARLAAQTDAPVRRASVVGIVAFAVLAAGLGVRQWRGTPIRLAREFEEANGDQIAKLQLIVKQKPNLVPGHFMLAQAYVEHERYPEAEAELKKVLELQPGNVDAQVDLGTIYLEEKRPQDAQNVFAQMIARDAGSADGHYGMGLVLASQQDYQAAVDEFRKAAASPDKHISGIYYQMGNSYANLKKYDDAIAAYSKEKELSGDNPDVESALADAYAAKGMTQQSQDARNRAAQMRNGEQ